MSEIYELQDFSNWSGFITSQYVNSATINDDGMLSFYNNGKERGGFIFNYVLTPPYVIELTYVETSGSFTFRFGFVNEDYTGTNANIVTSLSYGKVNNDYWGGLTNQGSIKKPRPVTGDVYRLEVYDDEIITFKNDEVLFTQPISISDYNARFAILGTDFPYKQSWKDIKIKLL